MLFVDETHPNTITYPGGDSCVRDTIREYLYFDGRCSELGPRCAGLDLGRSRIYGRRESWHLLSHLLADQPGAGSIGRYRGLVGAARHFFDMLSSAYPRSCGRHSDVRLFLPTQRDYVCRSHRKRRRDPNGIIRLAEHELDTLRHVRYRRTPRFSGLDKGFAEPILKLAIGAMSENIPEFGNKPAGAEYVLRPGGYVIAQSEAGEIAVLRTPKGYFLPGGGLETSESLEQAAIREAHEECGLRLEIIGLVGTADQLVFKASRNTYYRKRCTFFSAKAVGIEGEGETDHHLLWMSLDEAASQLTHQSQTWAVIRCVAKSRAENKKG